MRKRYYYSRKRMRNPLIDLAISVVSLLIAIVCVFAILSQPNALTFSFSPRPTPTPLVSSNTTSLDANWLWLVGCFGLCAILVSVIGLGILGIVFLTRQFTRKFTRADTRASVSQVNPSPIAPTPTMVQTTSSITSERQATISNVTQSNTVGTSINQAKPAPAITTSVPIPELESDVESRSIMSALEKSFFWALSKAVQGDYYIFPQVPLSELARQVSIHRIDADLRGMLNMGVVDFVLAHPNTLAAVLAFEFDDPSHRQANAQARDRRKDRLMQQLGIPLLRLDSREKWNIENLRKQILESASLSQACVFLDDSETAAFQLLRQVREDWYIFPKIRLEQIIRAKDWLPLDKYKTLKNDSVDFVFAHSKYLGTLLVVSLEDLEHSEKGDLLKQAKIPWISLGRGNFPAASEVRRKITQVFGL